MLPTWNAVLWIVRDTGHCNFFCDMHDRATCMSYMTPICPWWLWVFFTENGVKRWKKSVKVMLYCKFIHPRWVTFMKKWVIHTFFMSIILGFCQKKSYIFITHLHRGLLGSCASIYPAAVVTRIVVQCTNSTSGVLRGLISCADVAMHH
jgi:hypothetical protein